MKRRPAFTMIEILAVIAILSILIPILYRFHSTGVMGLTSRLADEMALDRDIRIFFKFLRSDLACLQSLDSLSLGKDGDEVTLTLVTLAPPSRRRVLFADPGEELFHLQKRDLQWARVVYRFLPGREDGLLVRDPSGEKKQGSGVLEPIPDSGKRAEAVSDGPSAEVALLDRVESFAVTMDRKGGNPPSFLSVKVKLKGRDPAREPRTVTGIFETGAFPEIEP